MTCFYVVSRGGVFTAEQAEVWDLLVTGYLAGVDAMAPGVRLDSVRAAGARAIAVAANDPSVKPLTNA